MKRLANRTNARGDVTARVRLWVSLCLALLPLSVLGAEIVVVRGGRIHPAAGKPMDEAMILVKDGKIISVGPNLRIPAGAKVLDARGRTILPGFLAVASAGDRTGIRDSLSLTPDASVLDTRDERPDRRKLLAGGITALFLSPEASKFLPGRGAVVKPGGAGLAASIVRRSASISINFTEAAFRAPAVDIFPAPIGPENPPVPSCRQFPSSSLEAYWGFRELLRDEPFEGEQAAILNAISGALRAEVNERLPLVVSFREPPEALRMIELAKSLSIPLILVGHEGIARLADAIKDADVSVIAPISVRPLRLFPGVGASGGPGGAMAPSEIAELVRKGIRVSFWPLSEKDLPDLFKLSQSFQRFGLSFEDLLKTLTVDPAAMFGVEDRIGSLLPGRDADILIYRSDGGVPFMRLEKVMVGGAIVHEE